MVPISLASGRLRGAEGALSAGQPGTRSLARSVVISAAGHRPIATARPGSLGVIQGRGATPAPTKGRSAAGAISRGTSPLACKDGAGVVSVSVAAAT